MIPPTISDVFDAIDVTWPAASRTKHGPWHIRTGQGGGSRVSAATANSADATNHIPQAEAAMRSLGQHPLFMLRPQDTALDTALAARGYAVQDPVTFYTAPIAALTQTPLHPVTTFLNWPPLHITTDIWAEGGIGPRRVAVMHRAAGPKIALLGRANDAPAAAAFVALSGPIAMLHALEVRTAHRRCGLARHMMHAAGHWAAGQGATSLTVLVTTANTAANALYTSLGMTPAGHYHYRTAPA